MRKYKALTGSLKNEIRTHYFKNLRFVSVLDCKRAPVSSRASLLLAHILHDLPFAQLQNQLLQRISTNKTLECYKNKITSAFFCCCKESARAKKKKSFAVHFIVQFLRVLGAINAHQQVQ